MACGSCGDQRAKELQAMVDPVTGKNIAELTMRERLEFAHRIRAKEIMERQELPPAERLRLLRENDDWLEANKNTPAFTV